MKNIKSFLLAAAFGLSITATGTASAFSFGSSDFSLGDSDGWGWSPHWGDDFDWGRSNRRYRYDRPYDRPSRRGWERSYRRGDYYRPKRRDRYYDYRGPAPGYYDRPPRSRMPAPEETKCPSPAPEQPESK